MSSVKGRTLGKSRRIIKSNPKSPQEVYNDQITKALNKAFDQVLPSSLPEERNVYIARALQLDHDSLLGKNMVTLATALVLEPVMKDQQSLNQYLQEFNLDNESYQEVILYVLFLQQKYDNVNMLNAPQWADSWTPAELLMPF